MILLESYLFDDEATHAMAHKDDWSFGELFGSDQLLQILCAALIKHTSLVDLAMRRLSRRDLAKSRSSPRAQVKEILEA